MKIKVHMLAFEDRPKVREVTLPDCIEEADFSGEEKRLQQLLDEVYRLGQNDFAIGPEKNTTCSVSVGDVIELPDRRLFVVASCGFNEINATQLIELVKMDRRDRHFCDLVS